MRILVYKGGAQYNALNRFSEQLAEGLKKLEHEVELVDLLPLAKNDTRELNAALKKNPNLVIGFNGMGADLKTSSGKPLYDAGECYYLELLLDHPAFHIGRVMRSANNAIAGVVDHTHIDYLKDIWGKHPCFFAPHGGIQSPDHNNNDRPIDVLFLGTGLDPDKERQDWRRYPISYQSILQEAYDEFLSKPQSWDKLLTNAAQKRHMHIPGQLLAAMVIQLEIVMRADYRLRILKQFDEAGIKVTIMGKGWEHAKFKNHELHPSVEFYDALKLLCKSKVSLNASPQFFTGTHERVFASMLNGAVSVTSASRYYVEHFKEGQHYLSYELSTLPVAIDNIKKLLKKPSKLMEVRKAAQFIAERDHTWKNRAREFLDKVQTMAVCQYLYKKQWF